MRRLAAAFVLAVVLAAPAAMTGTAVAATPNVVNITVAPGVFHYNQRIFTANAGLVRINFTNNARAQHNVSLEHNGEFEYGASLTIAKTETTTFLTLAKGTYHVYSSVGNDENKGLSATLIVK